MLHMCVPCAYLDKNKTETSHKNQNETHKSPIVFRILAGAMPAYIAYIHLVEKYR